MNCLKQLPLRRMVVLVLIWLALVGLNYVLISSGLNPDTPIHFPISVFQGPRLSLSGLPFTALFVVGFALAVRYCRYAGVVKVWAIGSILILLGNLAQGGLYAGLYAPFTETRIQYYHDAVQVSDWLSWLRDFNAYQPELLTHSQTHPPFAVLIHKLFLDIGGLVTLAFAFFLLSSCTIILVYLITGYFGVDKQRASQLALLFSVIPAFNIYCAVSLDGLIAMFCTLSLLGMVRVATNEYADWAGVILFVTGVLLANALSFGGVFLLLTAALVALHQIVRHSRWSLFFALSAAVSLMLLLQIGLVHFFGYNHIQAFFTASHLENPEGFRGFVAPLQYVMTRIEGVSEIALFLSLGVLAILLNVKFLNAYSRQGASAVLFFSAVASLGLMFLAGAFRTGETARVCLFFYPYCMLPLMMLEHKRLLPLLVLAGVQTISMQTLAGYHW